MRILHTPHPASSAIGVQFRSLSESGSSNIDNEADGVIRLFLFERGSELSVLVLQSKRSGRDLLIVMSQSEKAKDRWGCESHKESANDYFYCGLSRVVIGHRRWTMLSRDLR